MNRPPIGGIVCVLVAILLIGEIPGAVSRPREVQGAQVAKALNLSGGPGDIWRQFGRSERRSILENLNAFWSSADRAGLSRAALIQRALDAERSLPQDLLKEIRSLARGAGMAYPDLLALNLFGDDVNQQDECTLFVAAGSGSLTGDTIASKNRDFQTNRVQVLVLTRPEKGLSYMGMVSAGQVGVSMGMNEKGLSIADTSLPIPSRDYEGYSGYTIMENVLEQCSSVDEAISYINATAKHSGITYMVADREKAAFVETVPSSYSPSASFLIITDGVAYHTNHYLYEPFHSWVLSGNFGSMSISSYARYDRAAALVSGAGGPVSPKTLMDFCRDANGNGTPDRDAVMKAHPDVPADRWSGDATNLGISNELTVSSCVFLADGQYPGILSTMWMAMGNPNFSPYVPFHNAILGNVTMAKDWLVPYADGTVSRVSEELEDGGRYQWGALDAAFASWEDGVRRKENATETDATGLLLAGHVEQARDALTSVDLNSASDALTLLKQFNGKKVQDSSDMLSFGVIGLCAIIGLAWFYSSTRRRG